MADEPKPIDVPEAPPPKPTLSAPKVAYKYKGRTPKNQNVIWDCGKGIRIQPWKMNDVQIEKLARIRPDLVEKYWDKK